MHANYTSRPDVKLPHWARANGWAIWAMSDVLMALPKNHPKYKAILKQYQTFVYSLIKYQSPDGFWHNVIDRSDSPFFDNDTHGSFAVIFAGIEAQRMMDEDTK